MKLNQVKRRLTDEELEMLLWRIECGTSTAEDACAVRGYISELEGQIEELAARLRELQDEFDGEVLAWQRVATRGYA